MAIILPHPMTPQEIRVLQEFRRISAETLPLTAIKAIKHPVGGGEGPALSLLSKGYLHSEDGQQSFTLTEKAKEFLALEPTPESEEATAAADEAAE